jgi:hypothetical protein
MVRLETSSTRNFTTFRGFIRFSASGLGLRTVRVYKKIAARQKQQVFTLQEKKQRALLLGLMTLYG